MRLDEIMASGAAEQRVKRLKVNAIDASDRAKTLKAQANAEAERLRVTRSQERPERTTKSGAAAMIKPHS